MSRRISMSLGLAVLMVLILAGFAWAQTPAVAATPTQAAAISCPDGNFTDENGDGVCDYRNSVGTGQQRGAGNGIMQREGSYIDANGDGVCDNFGGAMGNHLGRSTRQGLGGGQMNPTGRQMMGRGWNQ